MMPVAESEIILELNINDYWGRIGHLNDLFSPPGYEGNESIDDNERDEVHITKSVMAFLHTIESQISFAPSYLSIQEN